jgi:zinc/manganese transport system substrate-binding protein
LITWNTCAGEGGKPVIAYHTSWRYFAGYTGVKIVAFMEPKPGVPPSPAHVFQVIKDAKAAGAKVVVQEPFYERKMSDLVAKQLGGKVLVLSTSVGGNKAATDYISLLTQNIQALAAAVR